MSDADYAAERSNPMLPMSKNQIALAFDGAHLMMATRSNLLSFDAVSGRPTDDGKFIYTQARQTQKKIGPIPEGVYWVNPSEIWSNAWYKRATTSAWGNYRITIHPFTTTETYGRGGFFIHGGDTPGSAGCIDLATQMDKFAEAFIEAVGSDQNCQIHLAVKYPAKGDFPKTSPGRGMSYA